MCAVKRSTLSRRDRAAATRRRILDAAFELFTEQGVPATTMGDVAKRARVAVQTVHFVFHTKAELLGAVSEDVSAKALVPAVLENLAHETDATRIIAILVDLTRCLFPKIAKLALAVEAAAQGDPIAAQRWEEAKAQRYRHVLAFMEALQRTGVTKKNLTVEDAADIYYALNSAAVYRELIDGRGWSEDRWALWLEATLREQLLKS